MQTRDPKVHYVVSFYLVKLLSDSAKKQTLEIRCMIYRDLVFLGVQDLSEFLSTL